jgi:hypothetical protein
MLYTLDLSGAWAKLRRAKAHIDAVHDAIEQKLGAHPIHYSLGRKFDDNQSAVIFYINRLVEIDDGWSLIIGDAIHNLRGALDHLTWQLAIRHSNGVEPKDGNSIQFPFETNRTKWPRKFLDAADAAKLEDLQPFNNDAVTTAMRLPHPLTMLQTLSNGDKHRTIEVTTHHPADYYTPQITLHDCTFRGRNIGLTAFWGTPQLGDEVFRVPVTATGPNPDAELDGYVSCYIAVRERWNVDDVLTQIHQRVETLLGRF